MKKEKNSLKLPVKFKRYEESLKTYRDNYSIVKTAKKEGMKEGIAQQYIKLAKKLKEKGVAIEIIAEVTEMSREQILKLCDPHLIIYFNHFLPTSIITKFAGYKIFRKI